MKSKIVPIIMFFTLLSIFFTSCEDTNYREYYGYAPVYMSYDELRSSIVASDNVPLENPGKIYFKDDYIFIIEELKGIHVYDNINPASPVEKPFLNVPGVVDMVIKDNYLYADSYVDLVILDVSDAENIKEVGRLKEVLPYTIPPQLAHDYPSGMVDKKLGLVTGWELKTIKERASDNTETFPVFRLSAAMSNDSFFKTSGGVTSGGVGVGGSMARFGIMGKVLYILETSKLTILDISDEKAPSKISEINPGNGMETMFLANKTMFLGTTTGMIIYDIYEPRTPVRKSVYSHIRSCDPVVVDDTLAYVTLRSGTNCWGNLNCLDVINIKDLALPTLVKSYPMTKPFGLGKGGDLLFICDGDAGLKVFDASDPRDISNHLIYTYPSINTFDVIPIGNTLILIGDDGLYQYDYSNIQNITLLSSILAE